ncbi:MAG: CRTAC1 family protein [Planctomycetes bacterium]|nr:CRTAC1 family protein [Planctomycetota bacterium]
MGILFSAGLALLLQQAASSTSPAAQETPAQEFLRIGRALYDGDCAPVGAEPARSIARRLKEGPLEPGKKFGEMADLGHEWLELGKVDEAIALLEEALTLARSEDKPKVENRIQRELGLAYLRLAENQNCVERHSASCCILPLGDGALHTLREPALKAREHYLWILNRAPEDLGARWVLNLLSMLLGEFPEGVPEAQRIPMRAYATAVDKPLFRDVATRAGVDALGLAGGTAAEDYDGDGWIDVLCSNSDPLGPLTYYHNNGDGSFADRSAESTVKEQLGGLNLIAGDYDNDGDPDVLVLRGAWLLDHGRIRKSLLQNERGATFVDVTRASGLAEPASPTQAGVFADFDSDGWLDLYVGCESRVETNNGQGDYPSQLYLAKGDGTFRDVAAVAGVRNDRYAKGAAAGDYDDDGDLDLFVSNIGKNRLYRNDGHARFSDLAATAGVEEPSGRSFATWFFDYDNDGRLDLWVGAYACSIADLAAEALWLPQQGALPCLYHNQGDGTFQNVAEKLGLARPMLPMGANFCDLDNDGWLDFYLGTGDPLLQSLMPNVMFKNLGGKRFEDITAPSGLGHLQKGHGVAFADFDHDGDQDLFHHLGGFVPVDRFQNALFENTGTGGHWLSLELAGTRSNRQAIGARIHLTLDTPAGLRDLYRAAGMVSSFGGSTHRQEIGLGDATRIARLEIRWPRSSEPQVFEDVPLDTWLTIREGEKAFERLERKSFRF